MVAYGFLHSSSLGILALFPDRLRSGSFWQIVFFWNCWRLEFLFAVFLSNRVWGWIIFLFYSPCRPRFLVALFAISAGFSWLRLER
jgi:hypothetical protein